MRIPRLARPCGLWLLALLAVLVTRAAASSAGHLLVRSWSPGSDVRQQSVQALLQTRDGYLWVGTGKGLLRFDGVSFTAFTAENTPGMSGDDISFDTLWEDKGGVLWAGTYGQGLVRNDHGRFTTFDRQQGLPDTSILRVDGDAAGTVWIFTPGGVVRWQKDHLQQVEPGQGSTLIPPADGRTSDFEKMGLWRHTAAGIERFSYGAWRRFPTPAGERSRFEDDVKSIYEDRLRRVWYSVRSQPGAYFCAHDGALTVFHGLPPGAFVSYQDRSGFLWLNDHGAHPARWKAGRIYPLPQMHTSFLLNVLEGANGVIWAGSFHTDLFQYRPRLIASLPTAGVPEVGSVLFKQHSGVIWAGGTDLLKLGTHPFPADDKPPLRFVLGPQHESSTTRALSEDAKGHLLIGSVRHPAGLRLDGRRLLPYLPRTFDHGVIGALLLASTGDQWIGTAHGLYRYNDQKSGEPELLFGNANVRCITETAGHNFWIGTTDGLLHFQENRLVPLTTDWKYGEVYGVADGGGGELWMATADHGIVRYAKGLFRAFGTADGLPTQTAYGIHVDKRGDLWIRSDVGLLRIRRQSVEPRATGRAGKLQVALFDQSEGLPADNMEPPGNEGFLAPGDDTLWFATPGGIASLHPSDLSYQAGSPRAILEEHMIDQSRRLPGSSITLTPGQHNLELHYTALGSRRPSQVVFRYWLHGYDQEWTNAGTRRVAYYTQLPPGKYSFEVQAANGDDEDWGTAGATAEVHVLTPFYRTWWAKGLLCCLLLGGLAWITHARRRTALERARSRQAFTHRLIATQEGERKRIAHELHDSLGQHLVLIRTLAMLPKSSVETPGGDQLTVIADQAAVALREVEDISYDLRPYQLDRLGLTKAILSLLETFQCSSSVHLAHDIENIDGFLPKDTEINLYRIVQEALRNVLEHAEATEVTVTVTQKNAMLRLVVADNGRGFDSSLRHPNHGGGLGLIGIKERAEALGGHAVIESAARVGTKVVVTVARVQQ